MPKEWINGNDGVNLKFKRETLLNYGMNRWGLNKASSVGPTSFLIRSCSPKTFEEWEQYYFENAVQKKRDGIRITKEYITELGKKLYIKISEVVQNELELIEEEECTDYAYNLVINRTYEGYVSEIQTIYGQLEKVLDRKVEPAPDEWDRTYNVDFFIKIKDKHIGLQIKPLLSGKTMDDYQWEKIQEKSHERFRENFGGKVFYVYSVKKDKKKVIHNIDIIDDIKKEIDKLNDE